MPLQTPDEPSIRQGWVRALLLFLVYTMSSVGAGMLVDSAESWFGISFFLAIVLVFLFRRFVDRQSFEDLGLRSSHLYPHAFSGLCLGTFLVSAATLVIYFLNGLEWIDIMLDLSSLLYSAVILMMVAFAEELVFRGYVLQNMMKSFNRWVSLLLSAALFTLVHASNPDVALPALINTFLAGLLTGITFIHTRSLWFPVYFHFSWNFVQGPLFGYRVSGIEFPALLVMDVSSNEHLNGGTYGLEGSFVCSTLLALAFSVWVVLERMKPQEPAIN